MAMPDLQRYSRKLRRFKHVENIVVFLGLETWLNLKIPKYILQ